MDYFEVIYHKDITNEQIDRIIKLKEEHWKYGVSSQKKWLDDNIHENDIHIMGYLRPEGQMVSYSNIVNVKVEIDSKHIDCLGLGNVCVSKEYEHKGHARELLLFVNEYIKCRNEIGILTCKADKTLMYSKFNWNRLEVEEATIGEVQFKENVMVLFGENLNSIKSLKINQNF